MTFPSYTISESSILKHAENLFEMVKNDIEKTQAAFFMFGFLNTPIGYLQEFPWIINRQQLRHMIGYF